MIPIVSVIKESFQEYEGEVSLVLFCQGCDLSCNFCHNKEHLKTFPVLGDAIDVLQKNITPLHTALVLLGGEFLIYDIHEIGKLCHVARQKGLKVKLFTNGMHQRKLYELLSWELLDSVSVDYKQVTKNVVNLPEKYIEPTCTPELSYLCRIHKALFTLQNFPNVDVEIRTTQYNEMTDSELSNIKFFVKPFGFRHIIQKDIRPTSPENSA